MAGGNVRNFIYAAVMTAVLFALIYSMNLFLDSKREVNVEAGQEDIIEDIEDIEASYYLIEYLEGKNGSCEALLQQLNYLESRLWKFDEKIRKYKEAQEEFTGDEFYLKQKRRLNRREIIQLSLLERMKKACGYNNTVILYFYGNCKTEPNCGEQGFVLSYINELIDPEISILSFDGDSHTEVVKTLMNAYNVTGYPCVIVEGSTHCGLQNRENIEKILCETSPYLSICSANINSTQDSENDR
ncbi:MAG: hypothetical protein KKD39_08195 [Candidatus Altiarchaeota archaeon]|nr:hypothetical protein [Candidatus Altiarchaeota archaeon]